MSDIARFESGTLDVVQPIITPEVMESYLGSLDVKPRTKEAYSKGVSHYFEWLALNGYTGGNASDVIAYKEALTDHYTASTVSTYLTAVRSFYAYTESNGCPNVASNVKGAKAPKGFRKDPLSPEQVKAVLSGIDRESPDGIRDYALVNLLVRTGLRTIEIERAEVGDLRQVGPCVVLQVQGKGRDEKDEYVVLTESALSPLREYLRTRGRNLPEDAPLFASRSNRNEGEGLTTRSIRRIVKDALRNAGIDSDRITAHSLRHTAVTLALMSGAPVQEVQAMARHANINTTMIYAHNIDRLAGVAERGIDSMLD